MKKKLDFRPQITGNTNLPELKAQQSYLRPTFDATPRPLSIKIDDQGPGFTNPFLDLRIDLEPRTLRLVYGYKQASTGD
ncbi:hypothetical protein DPMN_047438 [Dreissena polymorpha]|uniref:Uncharacterized protein n=1 Tax=Dreissena polymorpha TaxID=45954 RepID=A0A9D4D821_DREPO|nr:hypothetical protein DPMN_047438 [Dreissena polymorpha]